MIYLVSVWSEWAVPPIENWSRSLLPMPAPAMSMCAHLTSFSTKRSKKAAAVLDPPHRVDPVLLMSAALPLIDSLCSFVIGRCHQSS